MSPPYAATSYMSNQLLLIISQHAVGLSLCFWLKILAEITENNFIKFHRHQN